MIILGLAGPARAGKDTVADYLVARYGFVKFAFSDALYDEVQEAFGLEDQSLLRDAETKEAPTARLAIENCNDPGFVGCVHLRSFVAAGDDPLSPRQVLQWWGTEYRRAQNPNYWVERAEAWIRGQAQGRYPEQRATRFVNPTCRFENERAWIRGGAFSGNIWHIHRDGVAPVNAHLSEAPLPVLPGERELWNNDTIARLQHGVDLLMRTPARFVRVEPEHVASESVATEDQDAAAIAYARGH